MALELQKGRPADTTGRLDKEIRTYDLLDSLGVEYDRVDHAPAMTMEDCKEVDEILESMVCKNLFLCNRQETAFYLLMIPDTKVFHTKDLSAQIGSARLSFAKPEYMEKFLDITPGSVSVLGLMIDKEHQVSLELKEESGTWKLETNLYEYIPEIETTLISTGLLGEAFEPEQKFESPDGTPILFDTDYFGNKRPLVPMPGPFAEAEAAVKEL